MEHTATATQLVEFCKSKLIEFAEAESYWRKITQFGISLPRTSFENFHNLYEIPCKDFKNRKFN